MQEGKTWASKHVKNTESWRYFSSFYVDLFATVSVFVQLKPRGGKKKKLLGKEPKPFSTKSRE